MLRASFWILLTSAGLVGALLALPRFLGPPLLGEAIGWTVVVYHLVLVAGAWLRGHSELIGAWLFLAPLSLIQVLPDWILVEHFGVLRFPDLGGERFGPVPVYMAGLWVTPLLLTVWAAELAHRASAWLALVIAPLAAVAIFGAAEWFAPRYGLWAPRNVDTLHGVAPYILVAEAALGLLTWMAYASVQARALPVKVLAAAAVSAAYSGAAGFALVGWRLLP